MTFARLFFHYARSNHFAHSLHFTRSTQLTVLTLFPSIALPLLRHFHFTRPTQLIVLTLFAYFITLPLLHPSSLSRVYRRYDKDIKVILAAKGEDPAKNENYCAAYLAYLNNGALTSLREHGGTHSRGIPVRYDDIPNTLIDKVFASHFGYTPSQEVRALMMEQAGK